MIPLVIGAVLMFPLSGYFKRRYKWRDWVCRVAGIGVGVAIGYLLFAGFVLLALLGPALGQQAQQVIDPTSAGPSVPRTALPSFQTGPLPHPMSAGTPAVVVSKGLNLRAGPGADYQDIGDLWRCDRLEVIGEQGGQRKTHTLYSILEHHNAGRKYGATGTAYLTGTGGAIGALLLASGKIKEHGVLAPEQLDPASVFPMLRERGIEVRERVTWERSVN